MVENNFSIIIPAYNESTLINGTLAFLLDDNCLTHIEVVVVCNGCIDNTAAKVQTFTAEYSSMLAAKSVSIVILETITASKTNALNIGVEYSKYSVNVLLDADILIDGQDIQQLVFDLNTRKLKAISPKIIFEYSKSTFLVRQYYQVASQSYYNIDYRLSNVIALSASGVKQMGVLPEIIADDDYIRQRFLDQEHAVSQNCSYRFICAKTFSSLIAVLTRVERGNIQLVSSCLELEQSRMRSGYYNLSKRAFPFFVMIKLLIKIRAIIQIALGNTNQWERDESNRKV